MNRARILAVTLMAAVLTTLWFASPVLAYVLIGATTPATNRELGSIALNVTIAKSDVCGTDASITVDQGDSLYFCYTVTNTGNKVLRFHSLTDSAFGEVLSNVFYELQPGAVFHITKGPFVAEQSFTNAVTWSAKRWGNLSAIMANASAEVTVLTPEPDKPATVTVAHFAPFAGSVDGTSVSVFVNGGKVFENFKFGDVQKNVELPAGEYLIEIKPTGSDAVAISGSVTVEAGKDYTLAAIGDSANQMLELLPLVDDNEPAAAGAKVRIAHLSPFAADLEATKVDLCTDEGAVVAGGLPYKGVINPVLPAGDYNLKIAVAGTECATVALDLPSIRLADGDIYELYAIGIPGGAIPFTVAAHPDLVLTPEPDKPATVTVAHFAPFAGSVDGTSVSVFVNGGKVFENFKFGDVQKNVELPAGEYLIEIKPTGSDAVAISGSVTVEAGKDYTLAAIGDGANQMLELLPLVDDNEPAAGAKVRIAHLSPFAADLEATKVDLCTDEGAVVAGGLPYKGVINPVLPAGDYNLKIAVAGTECATVALDLPSIRLADGDIYELYAIGIPGGAIPFTVAAHPDLVLTPEPDKPAMITIALEANPESVRNFRFEGDLGRFRLDDANPDDGDPFGSNKSFEIEPGVYTVKQLVPYRWSLDSIVCTGGAGSVNLDSASVAITVGAGENITCTFTNLRNVFLRIHKYWDRDADGARNFERGLAGFEFKVYNGAGTLVDTQVSNEHGKAHFNHLPVGDYKICETPKDGWTNTQPGGDGCYTLSVGPKRIVVLRFGNVEAGGVTAAAAQGVMSGVEFHTDDYIDHDDENYSLNEPFVDADLNTPATAGKLFLPSVVR